MIMNIKRQIFEGQFKAWFNFRLHIERLLCICLYYWMQLMLTVGSYNLIVDMYVYTIHFKLSNCNISLYITYHNERDGVSSHRHVECLLNRVFRHRYQSKHQSSASLAFVRGIHRWSVDCSHKEAVTWKMFPLNGAVMKSLITRAT